MARPLWFWPSGRISRTFRLGGGSSTRSSLLRGMARRSVRSWGFDPIFSRWKSARSIPLLASRLVIVMKPALLERSGPVRIAHFKEKLSASVPYQIAQLR
jgi:hypothetical protein